MPDGETTVALGSLLEQIQQAQHENNDELRRALARQFIDRAAGRLAACTHRVIRSFAPDFAGQTDLVFSEAYGRLHRILTAAIPPARFDQYVSIAGGAIRNALKDLIRQKNKRHRTGPLNEEIADARARPEAIVESADMWDRILNIVAEAPTDLRECFDSIVILGRTHAESARFHQLTEGKWRARWERTLGHIRRNLGGDPDL